MVVQYKFNCIFHFKLLFKIIVIISVLLDLVYHQILISVSNRIVNIGNTFFYNNFKEYMYCSIFKSIWLKTVYTSIICNFKLWNLFKNNQLLFLLPLKNTLEIENSTVPYHLVQPLIPWTPKRKHNKTTKATTNR